MTKLSVRAEDRSKYYRQLFAEALDDKTIELFRKATHYCQPVGNERFRKQIEGKLGRNVGQPGWGRPRKLDG